LAEETVHEKKSVEKKQPDLIEVVIFKSDTCVFCPRAEEVVRETLDDFGENVFKITIINVSENPGAAEQYGVFALPTIMIGGVSVTGIPEPEILMKMVLGSKLSKKGDKAK
jgi:thiol-disulfide isomerase/thioredoxin